MKYSGILTTSVLALGMFTGCFDDNNNGTNPEDKTSGCLDKDNNIALSIDKDCELKADGTYHLQGLTFVTGATLTIGEGATIKGLPDGAEAALVINPGAKLMAIGTAAKPIVFTAGTSDPERGDLAGVVLLGKADLNLATETGKIEGLTDVLYGGTADDDNSGELKYVRIEYAGHLIGADNELNGLTMGGVGSATKISYVQVYEGLDDCFEWFGGAVSADHLVATGCDDDIFDWDQGWSGNLQFALGVHGNATSSDPNGIEADNLNNNEGNTPRSNPKVANLTLIGNGTSSQYGMHLRRGTAGHIVNSIVTGFKNGTVRISGNTSIGLAKSGGLKAEAIYAYGNGADVTLTPAAGLADSAATLAATQTAVKAWFTSDISPLGVTWQAPKPATAPTGAVAVPSGLAAAAYIGAFDPAASDLWTKDWTRTGESTPVTGVSCVEVGNKLSLAVDEDCVLPGGRIYHLQGLTFVTGATLTIGAGATIKGLPDGEEAALVINPGAKLIAIGTSTSPIVFTAGTSNPERGDLAGVVLLGKADLNLATETGKIEGLTDVAYGGTANDDNSGELKYVRIEYAGHLIGADNELNGLTLGGVGSATKISYVQVYEGLDDCFEWFGGAVSADHLVATGCDDDIFDWDLGWSGNLQFALGVHGNATSSDPNGIEADNLNNNEGNTPRSNPKVANLTLIGNGTSSQYGMHLRRGTAGHIVNSIVTGFKNGSVRISGNTSIGLAKSGGLKAEAIYAYGNGADVTLTPAVGLADSAATLAATQTAVKTWFTSDILPLGVTWQAPKPATAPTGAVAVPSGLAAAAYIGAFDPAASDLWTKDWTKGGESTPVTGATCLEAGNKIALTIDKDCALPGDRVYHLKGLTFVTGATLTIGAGATIKGLPDGAEAALVINPGAKLMAIGTAAKPIVFTAGTSDPERGDLAGVVLLGKADLNIATETGKIEGLTDVLFGGTADDDNSGELKYVRIEYAGHLIGADNELNGLTLGGVGSATKISYVQVYEGLDDCFEWFGGAVSADHLVATGCDDDIFDWDLGWRGNLQFAIGVHGNATSSDPNGIEADNLNNNEGNTPRSNPKVANLTLIGNGTSSQYGMHLRRGTAGHIVNSIVTGFKNGTVRISGNTSIGLAKSGDLKAEAIYAYGNLGTKVNLTPAAGLVDSLATLDTARTAVGNWFLADTASLGLSATVWKPTSAATGAVAQPTGLVAAAYLGAVDPAASDLWTKGWIKE